MVIEDLKLKFKYIEDGDNVLKITNETDGFNAYVIKDNSWYGIGLEIELYDNDYLEKFENVSIVTKIKYFGNANHKLIEIITNKSELYEQFSLICSDFLEYVSNRENRINFLKNPQVWFEKWRDLLGNNIKNESQYPFLAELFVINHLLKENKIVEYDDYGTHDIETLDISYEVKSTIERYSSEVHINGQHQLKSTNNKPLKLVFLRLEPSLDGCSIVDLKKELELKGYKSDKIEKRITNMETITLYKKYKILEFKLYDVDENFPKILPEDFLTGCLPKNIIKLEYVIDLNGLKCENINVKI